MARPTDWHVLDLDGDPTPGDVASVQALAGEFHDFADDVQRAFGQVSSLGADPTALTWIGTSADAFRDQFGKFPDDLKKLFTSYRMVGDALDGYWPVLQRVQNSADRAWWDAEGANDDLARATTTLTAAQQDLKKAQTAGTPTDAHVQAQTAAQGDVDAAAGHIKALRDAAEGAYNDRIAAAKTCAHAIHDASKAGIHNKHWWEHLGEEIADAAGEISAIAGDIGAIASALAPILNAIAVVTGPIPGLDVVTAGLAVVADVAGTVYVASTAVKAGGELMEGHYKDAFMDAANVAMSRFGGKKGGEGENPEAPFDGTMSAVGDAPKPPLTTTEDTWTHVFKGEAKTKPDGTVKVVGYHSRRGADWDRFGVKVTDTSAKDANGCYSGTVTMNTWNGNEWVEKSAQSSFFPDDWTPDQVKRAIGRASSEAHTVTGRVWQGKYRGIDIEGYHNPATGEVITGYPIVGGRQVPGKQVP
jgi:uncharacterized protein YukE